MVTTTQMRKIDVLLDAPLLRLIRDRAIDAGVENYLVLPVLSGDDDRGRWADDQVTGGAGSKVIFTATVTPTLENAVLSALDPLIDDYSLTVSMSDITLVTPDK